MDNLLGSITSTYDNASATASTSGVSNTLSGVGESSTDEELYEACQEFEAYFIEQILDKMQEAVTMDDEDTSSTTTQFKDYATDGLMEEYAKMISDSGNLGLADKLYEQMKRNYNV